MGVVGKLILIVIGDYSLLKCNISGAFLQPQKSLLDSLLLLLSPAYQYISF